MELEIALVISQILAFLALLWIMKKFAWKPFLNTLEARQKRIENEFKEIEEKKHHLQALSAQYALEISQLDEKVKETLKEASTRGDLIAQKIQEEAQKQGRAILEKTREEIAQELKRAETQLRKHVVDLVVETTEKMLEEKMDPSKDRERIMQILAEAPFK